MVRDIYDTVALALVLLYTIDYVYYAYICYDAMMLDIEYGIIFQR